jgi:insertion element IS1 protein InsB
MNVSLGLVEAAEMDEMWSFVLSKQQQRWLWHAIDHNTGKVLAYVLAPHEDEAFLKLKTLLQPFGITRFFTDGWGAYQRHLDEHEHIIGK